MRKLQKQDILNATESLQQYAMDLSPLHARIRENEAFWRMEQGKGTKSAWLINALLNKHADAMDNYPQAIVLPRHPEDKQQAESLRDVLPVILRHNRYEGVYSDMWWSKLKYGTAIQGVFWNRDKNRPFGDVHIKNIDILRFYWEPGIDDIQDSANVFYVSYINEDNFTKKYPNIKIPTGQSYLLRGITRKNLIPVIDWYYKTTNNNGKRILHYCKYAGDSIIYASQNDETLCDKGFYSHGMYPFVCDTLFTVKGSPVGFGYMDIMKDAQTAIDAINQALLDHARLSSKKRFFIRIDGGVNEEEFADFNRPFVHVAGSLNDDAIREINVNPLDSLCLNLLHSKVDEIKETAGNRDFNQGSTAGGITAASAIAALQEAGNKLSRDMIKSAYRAFTDVCMLCVELIRQFYTSPRQINIIEGKNNRFISFTNEDMQAKKQSLIAGEDMGWRIPEYDIVIHPQKASPFSTLAQNELAKEFYKLGFFDPTNAQQALACISMMNFDGKDELMANIQSNIMQI
ncbi:MAG: hypothetical protein GYA87_05290 [Christensenellaceae bacterium]|nr:hypothetical protein [Christensenellaceae bacterium]